MARVVRDDHQLLDRLIAQQEELTEARNGDCARVAASEERLLEEPFVEHDLEADSVLNARLDEELDDLVRNRLDQPGEDQNQ